MDLEPWDVEDLIREEVECEWLDFKEQYYSKEKKGDLLHDLLCMANAPATGSKYIVFGVSDDQRIVGMETSVSDNAFRSDIRAFRTNYTLPVSYAEFEFGSENDEKRVGVIEIQPSSLVPFFATEDFNKHGVRVRAGVIYGRHGSNNTPINASMSDREIEQLFRRRFGLEKSPKDRMLDLLQDTEKWLVLDNPDHVRIARYHHDFPEFSIETELLERDEFWEPWVERLSGFRKTQAQKTSLIKYYLRYHGTVIATGMLMYPRHTSMPFPTVISQEEYSKEAAEMVYELKLDTQDYLVAATFNRDRQSYDAEEEDAMSRYDSMVFTDVQVMFGGNAFTLERREEVVLW